MSLHCRRDFAEKGRVRKVCLLLGVWLAAVTARQEDWPAETRLERTAACPTAVLLIEPSHEDAESALLAFAATLADEPGARGHVVVLAGQGPVAPRVWRALRTLPRTEVHFVQDDQELDAFGVTNGLGFYLFDAWGRLKKYADRSEEAPVVVGSFRKA
jgi:hypothetical protein